MDWRAELEFLRGQRLYLDSNVWIYALEGGAEWETLRQLLILIKNGDLRAVTSELTLAETLVAPIRARNRALQSAFQKAICNDGGLLVHPVSRAIWLEAARLRAIHNLQMPDALHGATAKLSNCRQFLSADIELGRALNLPVTNVEKWKLKKEENL